MTRRSARTCVNSICLYSEISSTPGSEAGAAWIQEWARGEIETIKDLTTVYETMRYYQETQFGQDGPMKEMVTSTEALLKKFQTIPSLSL